MLRPSDRTLIAAAGRGDAAAFGELYRRHCDIVLAFFLTRTGDAGLAADLTAETFAGALAGCHRYRADAPPARLPSPESLARLPEVRREALRARILDELEYPQTARGLRRSPAVARRGRARGRTLTGEAQP